MTKEEAVNKAIEIEFGLGNARSIREHNSFLVKVAEHLYDLLYHSLPFNLDKAARKAAVAPFNFDLDEEHLYEYPYLPIAEQKFKEGAEWMAGQGASMIITDETEWAEVDVFVHRNCDGAGIIQIRKKD